MLAGAYLLLPLKVGAQAQVRVCRTAGDDCSIFISRYIRPFILLLSALIMVAAVISIIIAAIQYSSAGDNPSTVSKAKDRIFQTVIGILAYIFLFAFINFLVPGGLF